MYFEFDLIYCSEKLWSLACTWGGQVEHTDSMAYRSQAASQNPHMGTARPAGQRPYHYPTDRNLRGCDLAKGPNQLGIKGNSNSDLLLDPAFFLTHSLA